jgi:hypothetical protein
MNRKAAIDKLLVMADETATRGHYSISNTINDLARRIALSSYKLSDKKVINDCVSKMSAELMFRDDFRTAKKITKIAEDLFEGVDEEDESSIPVELMTPEESAKSTEERVNDIKQRLLDTSISAFEREALESKLKELQPEETSQEAEDNNVPNFVDRLKDLGAEINIDPNLYNS